MDHLLRPLLFLFGLLLTVTAAAGAGGTLSLAGEWRLQSDEKKEGLKQNWAQSPLPAPGTGTFSTVRLPGSTDLARFGDDNPTPPSLLGPRRNKVYVGPAWYEREFTLPPAWKGKRITLLLERAHGVTHAWLDGRAVGRQDSLATPHEFDLGRDVAPGRHRITLCSDNSRPFDLGRFASIDYEYAQSNWNGLIGRIELRATDPVAIDGMQIFPDTKNRSLDVRLVIANATDAATAGVIKLVSLDRQEGREVARCQVDFTAPTGKSEISIQCGLNERTRLWDEFSPALHELRVQLVAESSAGPCTDEVRHTYGLRDFTAGPRQFLLNGREIFLRGTVDCAAFPLTGFPPTDVAEWKRMFEAAKAHGMNHVRFHSWCPPEAAFAAADELGVFLQIEGPLANVEVGQNQARDEFMVEETRRILHTYGNHPSFCLYAPGHELRGATQLLTELIAECIRHDPRRLYTSSTASTEAGGFSANRQFTVGSAPRGIRSDGTDWDHQTELDQLPGAREASPRPVLSHEVGRWPTYPKLADTAKYTGVFQPANYELVLASLRSKGLLALAPRFVTATGEQLVTLYKEEIEALLRTPDSAGYQLLALQDYPGQGMALVGLLDAFWGSKGLIEPSAFRRFAGPMVPLLRMSKRTYFANEKFTARMVVSRYGPADLPSVRPQWRIVDEAGREIAAGKLPDRPLPTGGVTELGEISVPLATTTPPCKLTVSVAFDGTPYANDWEIWVYPPHDEIAPPQDTLLASRWDAATVAALAAGKKVLLFPEERYEKSRAGSFLPCTWSPVGCTTEPGTMSLLCDPQHPAFAQFPTEAFSNWQWLDLLNRSRTFLLNDLPADFDPIIRIIDNFSRNDRLGTLFEARVGPGRLLFCGFDLRTALAERPAAQQLLRSLYRYVESETFQPKRELSPESVGRLFQPMRIPVMQKLNARVVSTDSAEPGHTGAMAIDDDPASFWKPARDGYRAATPHELVIEFPQRVKARGVRLVLPPRSEPAGRLREFALYTSTEPVRRDRYIWGEPAFAGTCAPDITEKVLTFSSPTELRSMRLVTVSSYDPVYALPEIAEIELIAE